MRTLAIALALCLAACAHQKDELNKKEKASVKAEATKSGVQREKEFTKAERELQADEKKRAGARDDKKVSLPEPMETSSTTEQMFKPEGVRKLQESLQNKMKAYADAQPTDKEGKEKAAEKRERDPEKAPPEPVQVDENGKLDARTQAALRAFQKEQKLPETGLPDYATLKKLGIKPEELFEKMPTAQAEEDEKKREKKAEGKKDKDGKLSGKEKDEANREKEAKDDQREEAEKKPQP
jgi:peptidoglycan hydrolase-like protein with peptidoglycan-binding domain